MRLVMGMTMVAALVMVPSFAAAQDAAKGEQVYAAQKCSMCHQIAGKGNKLSPLDGVVDDPRSEGNDDEDERNGYAQQSRHD